MLCHLLPLKPNQRHPQTLTMSTQSRLLLPTAHPFFSLNLTTYQPGQDVSIVIDIKNTLSVENDVPVSDSWVYSDLGLGPCDNGPGDSGILMG